MPERRFEMDLDRWFGEAPSFPDAEFFALRLEARLDRGWTFRRLLIGGLGALGGVILGAQILGSGLAGRLSEVSALSQGSLGLQWVQHASRRLLPEGLGVPGLPIDTDVVWMSAALAAVALGFAVTRVLREF